VKPGGEVKKTTIKVITLGCSKNLVDSEKIMAQLPADRFQLMFEGQQSADIVIINTCGFINDAKEESIDTILGVLEARKRGTVREVLVTGCLSQRYKEELMQEIPEVDAWFGVHGPDDLFAYLKANYVANDPQRLLSTPNHYAYLKIAEGCDRTCSFCAIPMIRGAYRSLPVGLLVEETRMLAAKGVKEINLVAQDLSHYGIDISRKPLLGQLLQSLCSINGIEWIRLHYAYPHNFPDDVIQLMAAEPKICKYLDIPLQHINDSILLSMRRGHDRDGTIRFLERLRERVPGIALRTTLMVGYPGETEEMFDELMAFVRRIRFDRLGVFKYSPEENTRAYSLGDPVKSSVKKERAGAIMSLQSEISNGINLSRIGQRLKVIIDREESSFFAGRTEYDSPEIDNEVIIEKAPHLKPGQFTMATITNATEFDLHARAK